MFSPLTMYDYETKKEYYPRLNSTFIDLEFTFKLKFQKNIVNKM